MLATVSFKITYIKCEIHSKLGVWTTKKKKTNGYWKTESFYYKYLCMLNTSFGTQWIIQEKASNKDRWDPSYGLKPPMLTSKIQWLSFALKLSIWFNFLLQKCIFSSQRCFDYMMYSLPILESIGRLGLQAQEVSWYIKTCSLREDSHSSITPQILTDLKYRSIRVHKEMI